jgi:hypothetical protein
VVWLNYASNDSFRFALQLPPARPPAADLASATAGLLVNPMRQAGLSRVHALVMGAYLRQPARFAYAAALSAAAAAVAGAGGPLLERLLLTWSGLPDARMLAEVAGHDDVLARVRGCVAELDVILPDLRPHLAAEARTELEQAVERARLLLAALEARRVGTALERQRLWARLAATDDETACDARAVLSSIED